MMAVQWLQSSHDCSCLLHLISAVPTQQCAWETFHDSPLELLTQKSWLSCSLRPFSGMAKFTQGTSKTLKTLWLLFSSDFSVGQHRSCSKTRIFIGSNFLYIHQYPGLHDIFLSSRLESCAMNIIWNCSLGVNRSPEDIVYPKGTHLISAFFLWFLHITDSLNFLNQQPKLVWLTLCGFGRELQGCEEGVN